MPIDWTLHQREHFLIKTEHKKPPDELNTDMGNGALSLYSHYPSRFALTPVVPKQQNRRYKFSGVAFAMAMFLNGKAVF